MEQKKSIFARLFGGNAPTQEVAQPEIITAPKEAAVAVQSTPKLYTAEDVHRDLTAFVLMFLADIQQEIERKEVPATISRDAALLSEFGLTHSKNAVLTKKLTDEVAAHNKEYDRVKASLSFMSNVWQKFGTDVMVVRYDHFFQILEKYDMVCGSFDRYTGSIPQEALDTLTRLNGMWARKELNAAFATPFEWVDGFDILDKESVAKGLIDLMRMPVLTTKEINGKINEALGLTGGDLFVFPDTTKLSDVLFIAAPAADMEPMEIDIRFDLRDSDEVRSARERAKRELGSDLWEYPHSSKNKIERAENEAIRAEEERLQSIIEKSSAPRYCKCCFIKTAPLPERKLYDPFICSLTPHGVLIHAKWGAEAEDATIKRYEQLRDAIIGKGGRR